MPKINEATDTDPCLILAGTSLKVIERLQQLDWKCGKGNMLKRNQRVVFNRTGSCLKALCQ